MSDTMDTVNEAPGTCDVCTDQFRHSNLVRMPCGIHSMCALCIDDVFRLAFNKESLYPPTCCGKGGPAISLTHVEHMLEPAFIEQYRAKEAEYATEWKSRTYCAKSNCGNFIPPESMVDNDAVAVCNICSSHTCVACKILLTPNEPHTCSESDQDALFLEQVRKQGWQRCYQCRAVIELAEACNHITCESCGAEFCYVCGTPWTGDPCPNGCPQHGEIEYDAEGYGPNGYHRDTGLDRLGLDQEGYNAAGFDWRGRDRNGRDIDGLDSDGNPPQESLTHALTGPADEPNEQDPVDHSEDEGGIRDVHNNRMDREQRQQRQHQRPGLAVFTNDELAEDRLLHMIYDLELHGITQTDDFLGDGDGDGGNKEADLYGASDVEDADEEGFDEQLDDNLPLHDHEYEHINDFRLRTAPEYTPPPPYEPPTPSPAQIECQHNWQFTYGAGRCSICAWQADIFTMVCGHCHTQVCRTCSYSYLDHLEYHFPGAVNIGLATFSATLDREEDEAYPFIDGFHINSLHDRAEAEYDDLHTFETTFYLDHIFDSVNNTAGTDQNSDGATMYVWNEESYRYVMAPDVIAVENEGADSATDIFGGPKYKSVWVEEEDRFTVVDNSVESNQSGYEYVWDEDLDRFVLEYGAE